MDRVRLFFTISFMLVAAVAQGQVAVSNVGFEAATLGNGNSTINTFGGGWVGLSGGNAGILNPSVPMFTEEAPEGMNVAYSNGRDICQEIGVVVNDTFYAATARVGVRLDVGGVQNCGVELRSASGVRCRAEADPAPVDAFTVLSCEFTAGSADLDAGQPLDLCLSKSSGLQCNFDTAYALGGELQFADGFESGNTSAWAVVVP